MQNSWVTKSFVPGVGRLSPACRRALGILFLAVAPTIAMAQAGDAVLDTLAANSNRLDALESGIEWHEADLAPSWTVYGSYQPFVYGRTNDGLVLLTGMMSGCASRETPVFVLPVGFRPPKRQIFEVAAVRGGAISIGHVYVHADGRVIFYESYQPWGARDCDIQSQPSAS